MEFHDHVSKKLRECGIKSKFTILSKMKKEPGIIFVVSIFQMERMYKDCMIYANNLHKAIVDLTKRLGAGFYVYLDDSFHVEKRWQFLYDYMVAHPLVTIIKYDFPGLKSPRNQKYHFNLFGTLVRFIPLFKWHLKQKMQNIVIIDADMFGRLKEESAKFAGLLQRKETLILTAYTLGYCIDSDRLVDPELDDHDFPLRIQAVPFGSNMPIPCSILVDFLACAISRCEGYAEWTQRMKSYEGKSKSLNDDLFIFGSDELFLNSWLLNYFINSKTTMIIRVNLPTEALMYNYHLSKVIGDKAFISKFYEFVSGTEKKVDVDLYNFMTKKSKSSVYFKKVFKWIKTFALPASQAPTLWKTKGKYFASYIKFLARLNEDTEFVSVRYATKKKYTLKLIASAKS